jgi:hypothetical protein
MAKKITINGENILNGIDDDWGGQNSTQEAITIHGIRVPVNAEWGVTKKEVERVIKKTFSERVGCIRIVTNEAGNGHTVLGFQNEND